MASLSKEQRTFGEIALARGLVDRAALEAALERAKAEGLPVADVLEQAGALGPSARALVQGELEALAFTCSSCGRRDFHVVDGAANETRCEECARVAPAPPPATLLEGRDPGAGPAWQVTPSAARPRPNPSADDQPTMAEVVPEAAPGPAAPPPAPVPQGKRKTTAERPAASISQKATGERPAAAIPEAVPARADGAEVGQLMGGCRILSKLGQGGMGRVYKGHHAGLDRDMAIKVLDERLVARQGFVEQFFVEARLLAKLDHPNIVRVFNVDKDPNGVHFILMELLSGGSVHALWQKRGKKLPVEEAVRIVSEAAQGLHHAHQKHLLHRDVKPANLMLAEDGRVKVVDFGLAVPTENELFVATAIAGTPHYMAPEQADGLKLDTRCDQYALGVTLFQLLCGALPFERSKAVEILFAHMTEAPPRPRDLRADLPEWIERVILKMMAKAPGERFATLADVVAALEKGEEAAPAPTEVEPVAPKPPEPRVRLDQIVALEKGLKPQPIPLPTWRPAIAIAAASLVAAALFLAFPAREALGRGEDLGRDDVPVAVREVVHDAEKAAASGTAEALAATVARLAEAAQDLGSRPGAARLDGFREALAKRLAQLSRNRHDELQKSTDTLVSQKRFGAAIEAIDPASSELAALGLGSFATDLRTKVAQALAAERDEVYVSRGSFLEGVEGKATDLPGFYIDRTEVTNAAWAAAREKAGLPAPASWRDGQLDPALANRPVTGVSFEEAQRFAKATGKRLPTSLEWEKAARGTQDARAYPWGAVFEPGRANVLDGGSGALEDAGARDGDASPSGVRDLAGNALEWVVGEKGALVAGGGFLSHAVSARVTARLAVEPGTRDGALGFRCARDLEAP